MSELESVDADGENEIVVGSVDGLQIYDFRGNVKSIPGLSDFTTQSIRVPAAVGDFMILDAIRESHGTAVAVEEHRVADWMRLGSEKTGISMCPESATCVGAVEQLAREGWIEPGEKVVIFNCGALQKNVDLFDGNLPTIRSADELKWD